jgi:hypothetical protein
LVLELCVYGSLNDVLRGSDIQGVKKPALKLSLADKMYLALGCALGLEALHSYNVDLCHRDIKSFNFLSKSLDFICICEFCFNLLLSALFIFLLLPVDSQLNAKIADLDLGQQIVGAGAGNTPQNNNTNKTTTSQDHAKGDHATGMNITWQAPEVLLGQGYTQKADIHSLALVLWEIIASGRTMKKFSSNSANRSHNVYEGGYTSSSSPGAHHHQIDISTTSIPIPSIPYADCRNQAEVREKIIRGYRPSVSAFIEVHPVGYNTNHAMQKYEKGNNNKKKETNNSNGSGKVYIDPLYVDIITRGWSVDPSNRPPIGKIVRVLRQCYANAFHRFICETPYIVNYDKLHEESLKKSISSHHMGGSYGGKSPGGGEQLMMGYSPRTNFNYRNLYDGMMITPSKELMESVGAMKLDKNWAKLEEDGAYVVLSPYHPFYMIWTTKKWTQVMGYFIHDILGVEINLLFGPKTDVLAIHRAFEKVIQGYPQHLMCPFYRRDGREILFSVNIFPVFDNSGMERKASNFSLESSNESSRNSSFRLKPGTKLSFSSIGGGAAVPTSPPPLVNTTAIVAGGVKKGIIPVVLNENTDYPDQHYNNNTSNNPNNASIERKLSSAGNRIDLMGDPSNILKLPPVGFMDLLSRSSYEYTTVKDIKLPAPSLLSSASREQRGSGSAHASTPNDNINNAATIVGGKSALTSALNNNNNSDTANNNRNESTSTPSEFQISTGTRPSNLSLMLDHLPTLNEKDFNNEKEKDDQSRKSANCFPFYEKFHKDHETESLLFDQHLPHVHDKPVAFIVMKFSNLKEP